MESWKFIKEHKDVETGWQKWGSSKMELEQWLGGGNKEQEVRPELISRINELGGKRVGREVVSILGSQVPVTENGWKEWLKIRSLHLDSKRP